MITRNPSYEVFGVTGVKRGWSKKRAQVSCITECLRINLPKKRNVTAISLILIPEYSQSNENL